MLMDTLTVLVTGVRLARRIAVNDVAIPLEQREICSRVGGAFSRREFLPNKVLGDLYRLALPVRHLGRKDRREDSVLRRTELLSLLLLR